MKYYPINLDIRHKKVLVIGAGSVALQKIEGLLLAGAQVSVVAKEASPAIRELFQQQRISLELRAYQKEDLKGAFLVFAATNDFEVNRQIHQEALNEKVLFNAVDQAAECDFTIPARVHRGDLLIAISSGGRAPFISKLLRKYFEKKISPEWDGIMLKLITLREKMIHEGRGKEFASYVDEHSEEISQKLMCQEFSTLIESMEKAFGLSLTI